MRPFHLTRNLLELIFPAPCPLCHEALGQGQRLLCGQCIAQIQQGWKQPRCSGCLRPVRHLRIRHCTDCQQHCSPFHHSYLIATTPAEQREALRALQPSSLHLKAWASLSALCILRAGHPLPSALALEHCPLRTRWSQRQRALRRWAVEIARLLSRPLIELPAVQQELKTPFWSPSSPLLLVRETPTPPVHPLPDLGSTPLMQICLRQNPES